MIRFWWVRHGPTHAKGMVGWTDLPADLSDHARIARLADHLPEAPVIASDLIRARETADAIAGGRPRLPHDRDLREIHFGDWEARRHDEIDEDRLKPFFDQAGDIRAPGGESWNQVRVRVDRAIERLLAQDMRDVIVVAHMGTILTQVQRALAVTPRAAFAHRIDNLSVTRILFDGTWVPEAINHHP